MRANGFGRFTIYHSGFRQRWFRRCYSWCFRISSGTLSVIVGALGKSATISTAGTAASTDGGATSVGLLCSVGGGGRGKAGWGNPVVQQGGTAGIVVSYDKILCHRRLLSATATPARLTVGTQETGMVLFPPLSFSLHILPMETVRLEAPQPDIPEVPVLPVLQVLMDMLK